MIGFHASRELLAHVLTKQEKYTEAEEVYLHMLEDDDTPATRKDLGILYLDQDKPELAIGYFTKSIEADPSSAVDIGYKYAQKLKYAEAKHFLTIGLNAGVLGSGYFLALITYIENGDKQLALKYLSTDKKSDPDDARYLPLEILIGVWTGDFRGLSKKVANLLQSAIDNNKHHVLASLFEELLCHGQVNLVKQFFTNSQTATLLQETFLPLYYVVLQMSNSDDQHLLKAPPELVSTIDALHGRIEAMKEHYYGKSGEANILGN